MKPSWDEAPEWAEWLAMDAIGRWVWFEFKPVPNERRLIWMQGRDFGYWRFANQSEEQLLACVANRDWKDQLESRP